MSCDMMISLYPFNYATTQNIPFIAWDLNPNIKKCKKINNGYISTNYDYYVNTVKFYSSMIDTLYKHDRKYGDYIEKILLHNDEIKNHTLFPTFVNPFYWIGYDENIVEKIIIKELGWENPIKEDGLSSKCTINKFHIDLKNTISNMTSSTIPADNIFEEKIFKDLNINMSKFELEYMIKNSKIDPILKLGSNLRR